MRLHFGPPPNDEKFAPEADEWLPLRELNAYSLQLAAAPIGIVVALVLSRAWLRLVPSILPIIDVRGDSVSGLRFSYIEGGIFGSLILGLIAVVHELLHVLAHPNHGRSSSSIVAIWPSRCLVYAAYLEGMTRNGVLLALLMPFFVISVIPLVACSLFRINAPCLPLVSVLNGFLSCGDLLIFLLLICQVPSKAKVRNQGWRTWWKT
jgi:hypothetical protein